MDRSEFVDPQTPLTRVDVVQKNRIDTADHPLTEATRRVTAGCRSGVPWASRKMTRRLPEGSVGSTTKIPRIQILMSPDVLLVGTGRVPFPQLEGRIGQTRSVRKVQLDEPHRSAVQILPPPRRESGQRLAVGTFHCLTCAIHRGAVGTGLDKLFHCTELAGLRAGRQRRSRPVSGRSLPGDRRLKFVGLENDFDFNQAPRAPVLLLTNPATDSPSIPAYFNGLGPCVGCTAMPPST